MMVTVSGMESAGSTAVWQMIHELGFHVTKEHGHTPSDANRWVFATLRDPRDVVASLWRRECLGKRSDSDNYALACWRYIRDRFPQMRRYEREREATIIRYEDFISDPGATLDMICQTLGKEITEERRNEILAETSLQKNKQRASAMQGFGEWDRATLIHGNHISSNGKVGSWQDLVPELKSETIEHIEAQAHEFLVYFGYETE